MKYVYACYRMAKAVAIRNFTPPGETFPRCAICGEPARDAHAHHTFHSRRYLYARFDIRNLAIVHGETEADCHKRAHGGENWKAKEALRRIYGTTIIAEAEEEWTRKSKDKSDG